jgi:hypothetical protein
MATYTDNSSTQAMNKRSHAASGKTWKESLKVVILGFLI